MNRMMNQVRVLTAPGASALAVVRISGPAVGQFLAARFSKPVPPIRPTHGELHDAAGVIDDPVVILDEDGLGAQIVLHGSAWIVETVIRLAEADGFILGEPEPTNIEEAIEAALPRVKTELAARMLLAQRDAWRDMTACDEAGLRAMLADRSLIHLLSPPTLAIVGLPNAGKSTLANALFGTRRSIVSSVAGTTRDWVGEPADLDGLVVTLVDTPGQHQTADPIEQQAIDASGTQIARADLVIVLLDATRDDAAQQTLRTRHPDALVVLNKWDARLPAWSDERITRESILPIAAQAGVGLAELIQAVQRRFDLHQRPLESPRVWTEMQRQSVEAKRKAIHS